MYTGTEERGIEILTSFVQEAGIDVQTFTRACDGLRSRLNVDESQWLLFLHGLGSKDLEKLNIAREYFNLQPWSGDDVITKL